MNKKVKRKAEETKLVDLTPLAKAPKEPVTKKSKAEAVQKMNKMAKEVKKNKVKPKFTLSDIEGEMDKFELELLTDANSEDIPCYIIPWKSKALQFITGGIMGGKFHEISGDSQTGKSYLLFELYSAVQKMGGVCFHQDGERAFTSQIARACDIAIDGTFAKTHERDINKLFAQMLNFIKAVRKKDKTCPILLGIDSFPSLQTKLALDTFESGKEAKGYAAMQKNAAFSQAIEKFVADLDTYDATLILINQTRTKKGIVFGDPTITLAEEVVKFWCTQRIQGKHVTKIKSLRPTSEKKEPIKMEVGIVVSWKAIKNRLVAPFQKAQVQTLFSKGILPYSGMAELLTNHERIKYYKPKKNKKEDSKADKEANSKKPKTAMYTHLDSGEEYESIVELIKDHPEVLNPIKIGEMDDSELVEEGDEESADSSEE